MKFEDNFLFDLLLILCCIKVNTGRLYLMADESIHILSIDLNPSKPEARKYAANSSLGLQMVELFMYISILDILYICHIFSLKNYLLLVHLYFFSLPSYTYIVFFNWPNSNMSFANIPPKKLPLLPALAPPNGIVSNFINPENRTNTYIIIVGIFINLIAISVILRLYIWISF